MTAALVGCSGRPQTSPRPDGPAGTTGPNAGSGTPGPSRGALPRGVLIRGANIAVKSSYYPDTWNNLWIRWDWDDWIKWQIDLARSLGANGIRLIGAVAPVTQGAITKAQYVGRWRQFLEYLSAHGMWAYPCVSDLRHWGSASVYQAVELYRDLGAVFDHYPNVVGIDVSNEAQFALQQAGSAAHLHAILTALTDALRATTSKALSHSWSARNAQDVAVPWMGRFPDLADFADLHLYYTPRGGDLAPLFQPPLAGLPLLIGEFGISIDEPPAARTARYVAVRELVAAERRIVGAMAWDIAEDDFGLFDTTGRPRHDITAPFTTFPLRR